MNSYNRGVLIGMVLGDGYIQVYKRKEHSGYRSQLVVNHSEKQRSYADFKCQKLQSIFGGKKPKLSEVTATLKCNNKSYNMVRFVKNNQYFRQLRKLIYPRGKKTYTKKMLDMLNIEGLCYWYLDDGHCKKNKNFDGEVTSISVTLACHCSEEEAVLIRELFKKYDIDVKIYEYKPNHTFCIRMNTVNGNKFFKKIEKYVPDCMQYKIAIGTSAQPQ